MTGQTSFRRYSNAVAAPKLSPPRRRLQISSGVLSAMGARHMDQRRLSHKRGRRCRFPQRKRHATADDRAHMSLSVAQSRCGEPFRRGATPTVLP